MMRQSTVWAWAISFMRWWKELGACVPRRLRRLLKGDRRQLVVEIDGEQAVVQHRGGQTTEVLGEFDVSRGPDRDDTARRLLRLRLPASR